MKLSMLLLPIMMYLNSLTAQFLGAIGDQTVLSCRFAANNYMANLFSLFLFLINCIETLLSIKSTRVKSQLGGFKGLNLISQHFSKIEELLVIRVL